jgi:radical SAM protein with 4Fe4S-binding SPASM domain
MDSAIRKPRIVAFEVTQRCKMNCIHCRASATASVENDLTTAQCKKIIKSLADYNRCVLIFTGGEPFERSDIFDLIDYAHSLGLAVSLATCGYNFDSQTAQRLKKSGVLTLSFSLDSDNAKTHDDFRRTSGAFEKTIAAINIAKSAGLRFQINTTVTKLNFEKLTELAKLSETLGAYCFNPFMLVPAGRAKNLDNIALSSKQYEQTLITVAKLKIQSPIDIRFTCAPRFAPVFKSLYPDSKKKAFLPPVASAKVGGCLAASDFAFISHSGDVQTCGFLPISAGNILQAGSFASIWESSDFLNSIRKKNFIGKCGTCDFVQICGGCRARAFAQTGDYLASDPLCSYSSSLQQSHENSVSPHHGVYPVRCETISSGAGFRAANVSERSSSVSTLIAAHVEPDKLSAVADAINALPNVSHNYLRKHHYNLWFTLKAPSSFRPKSCAAGRSGEISSVDEILENLSKRFNVDFLSFPSTACHKLDSSAIKRHNPPDNFNALFCCMADDSAVNFLCSLPQVSHCIERKTGGPNWPYNLYAVFHEKDSKRIEKIVAQFAKDFKIDDFQILPTVRSLKV